MRRSLETFCTLWVSSLFHRSPHSTWTCNDPKRFVYAQSEAHVRSKSKQGMSPKAAIIFTVLPLHAILLSWSREKKITHSLMTETGQTGDEKSNHWQASSWHGKLINKMSRLLSHPPWNQPRHRPDIKLQKKGEVQFRREVKDSSHLSTPGLLSLP